MKSIPYLFICILMLGSTCLLAQEFEFSIEFEDAMGNKDTIVLGLDSLGTNEIDDLFGEDNIILDSLNKELDVRITNEWINQTWYATQGTLHTKKQIFKSVFEIIEIDIKSNNYPITARWNSDLFSQQEIQHSVLTSINPGGWWDTGSPSDMGRVNLIDTNAITFEANFYANSLNRNYSYINENQDTISVFWFAFDPGEISINIKEIAKSKPFFIYPNPSNGIVQIEGIKKELPFRIFDLNGRMITAGITISHSLEINEKGIFMLQLYEDGQWWSERVVVLK